MKLASFHEDVGAALQFGIAPRASGAGSTTSFLMHYPPLIFLEALSSEDPSAERQIASFAPRGWASYSWRRSHLVLHVAKRA